MFFYGFLMGGMQLVIDDAAAYFGVGKIGLGALVSVQHVSAMAMPLLMGAVADRIGTKKVLCAFCAIFGFGCLVSGGSRTAAVYAVGALLFGAGYSVCESQTCAVFADLDPEKAARRINLSQGLLCVGAILGPVCVQAIQTWLGADWRVVFYICAAAFLLLTIPLCAMRFPKRMPAESNEEKAGLRIFFASGAFVAMLAAMMLYVGLENGYGYFADSLFMERLNTSGAAAISIYWAGMALSRIVFSVRPYKNRPVLIAHYCAAALLFAGMSAARSQALMLVLSALIGAAYGPIWSTLVAEAAIRFPEHTSTAAGLMSTACGVGGIVYPLLMGAAVEKLSITAAMILLAVTAALGGALCMRIRK